MWTRVSFPHYSCYFFGSGRTEEEARQRAAKKFEVAEDQLILSQGKLKCQPCLYWSRFIVFSIACVVINFDMMAMRCVRSRVSSLWISLALTHAFVAVVIVLSVPVYLADEDVLDTWFSSALFPFSIFGWPEQVASS